jgi:N-acyl-D-amino-acid deacylase
MQLLRVILGLLLGAAGAASAPSGIGGQAPASTVIRNAVVVDGTGTPGRRADVRIVGGRIAAVGGVTAAPGDHVIDARGLTLAPGFIDTHSHHDRGLADAPDAPAAVSQGITTIVVGQDGSSGFPLAESLARFEEAPPAVNIASYVGHGRLRLHVLGADYKRAATPAEVARMEDLLRKEMEAGALGLSTGLEYDPGIYSAPGEVLALARVAAAAGGRYISHLRSEDRRLFEAVDEAIAIGREARIPVQISHVKLAMRSLWGQADKLIKVMDAARASGVQLTADIYPYTYWQSGMTVLFPSRDFNDRREAEFVLRELVAPQDLLIVSFDRNPAYIGKTVAEISKLRGIDPPDTVMALIEESGRSGPGIVATSMHEDDVASLMQWPFTNICSDGTSTGGHPRGFGSYPRVLGRYVRERKVLGLEEAVRKMTSLAASNVGIADRGTIERGRHADLVLFDPARILDRATTGDARAVSVGVQMVWVNGEVVLDNGVASTGSGQVASTGSGQVASTGSGQAPSTGSGQVTPRVRPGRVIRRGQLK